MGKYSGNEESVGGDGVETETMVVRTGIKYFTISSPDKHTPVQSSLTVTSSPAPSTAP